MIILMTLKVTAVDLMVTSNRAEKNPSSLFQTKREILQQYVWLVCFAAQCASHKTNISQETRNNGGTWHQSGTPGAKGGFWKRQIFSILIRVKDFHMKQFQFATNWKENPNFKYKKDDNKIRNCTEL